MEANAAQAPADLVGFLDFYLVRKAPVQLPAAAKEWIVRYAPWIALVLLVIALPAVLFALGIGVALMPFGGVGYAAGFTYVTVVLVVELALTGLAIPGLIARKMSGWRLAFYARIVGIASSILSGAIAGAIVGGVLGLYLLFQIRPLYRS